MWIWAEELQRHPCCCFMLHRMVSVEPPEGKPALEHPCGLVEKRLLMVTLIPDLIL